MLTSEAVKKAARAFGADLCGIASMDRFEGARGCLRECLAHLDERGVLTRKFFSKFRRGKPWQLPPLPDEPWWDEEE